MRDFAPRALLAHPLIVVEITPSELHRLIRSLEAEVTAAIDDGRDDYADFVLLRVAQLREEGR